MTTSRPPTLRLLGVAGLLVSALLVAGPVQPRAGSDSDSGSDSGFHDPELIQLEGWTVRVDPALLSDEEGLTWKRVRKALANHLQRVEFIVAPERLVELRRLPIWIDLEHPRLKSMQYHPGKDWLVRNGHDPRLVRHVHIPRARALLDPSQWAKHPYVVLHELAHAYHDQVLDFDHAPVREAFEKARDAGIYDEVLAHTGRRVRHYALSNHKEYFAESTEAYFGVNDFYPFVRAELREHDPRMYEVLEKIWGKIP